MVSRDIWKIFAPPATMMINAQAMAERMSLRVLIGTFRLRKIWEQSALVHG
jgi:hypothetical protein